MPRYLILAQSEATANALSLWVKLLAGECHSDCEQQTIIWEEQSVGLEEKFVLAYQTLTHRLEMAAADFAGSIPINEIIVLVDTVQLSSLNPLTSADSWDSMIAMLILTFPEIKWIFAVVSETDALPRQDHSLRSLLFKPISNPLFDATGLRDFIRRVVNIKLLAKKNAHIPVRPEKAAAIDEETSYALFHAYTTYRFGYRAEVVCSWSLMNYLFGKPAEDRLRDDKKRGHGFHLLLEDVNLNFPDKPGSTHLSTFAQRTKNGKPGRATHCPLLKDNPTQENSKLRIIVTSGHSGADADKMKANRAFVEAYKGKGGVGFVPKPVGGMFDLWNKAKLFTRLNPRRDPTEAGRYRGQAPGFFWPPLPTDAAAEAGGHSAPGKLMLIAQHLVRRADALRDTANTVDECIRGAVLATDALELLRYQTPTLALQALCLKHEFEVKAEVAFLGVGYHFDLKRRLDELERDVKAASRYFQKRRRRAAELDTLVSIGNRLMLAFREAGQFDEEQSCLARIRYWHRCLRFHQTKNPLEHLANLFMAYAEFLLAKPTRFLAALFVWYVVLVGLWLMFDLPRDKDGASQFIAAASAAWNTFAAANPGQATGPEEYALNVIGSAAGLFHLGVFISYLYSVVTRK